ncbi:MAG: CinA family protein [Candidatus Dormibacteraeota bacterium]|nr:CinA family protein [Candidatus Dormibacteraeota bacterium]
MLANEFDDVAQLGDVLRRSGDTVAVAESCTGGLLGAVLTELPGSSDYMRGGVIAYADDVKADLLGVSRHELALHGAVSEPVARAMASGVRMRCGASVGIGITGVAGPGASAGKPAGLIFVAVRTASDSRVSRLTEDRGREANRTGAVRAALRLCLELVGQPPPTG